MTEIKLAALYRDACTADRQLLADVDVAELIDLAHGRLAGARRAQLVDAIAASPSLAQAYRLAKASGDWSTLVAADLARGAGRGANVHAMPVRHSRPAVAVRRHRFAVAAAVSAMAVGAVFVSQRLESPTHADTGYAMDVGSVAGSDAIALMSFDAPSGRTGNPDVIFTSRTHVDSDRIFAFGKGS